MNNDKLIATAKVSSQGQVTLPKIVRDSLNVENGELVIFTINKNGEIKIKNTKDLNAINNDKIGGKNGWK